MQGISHSIAARPTAVAASTRAVQCVLAQTRAQERPPMDHGRHSTFEQSEEWVDVSHLEMDAALNDVRSLSSINEWRSASRALPPGAFPPPSLSTAMQHALEEAMDNPLRASSASSSPPQSTSDGEEANEAMASLEGVEIVPVRPSAAVAAPMLDDVMGVLHNVLNNERIMNDIHRAMLEDPAYHSVIAGLQGRAPDAEPDLRLPAAAEAAARQLPEALWGPLLGGGMAGRRAVGSSSAPFPDTFHDLMMSVLSSLSLLSQSLSDSFVRLGGFVRGLGESLRQALGPEGTQGRASGSLSHQSPTLRRTEIALARMACALAVIVLLRRAPALMLRA